MSILHKIFTFFFILNYIPKIIKSQSVEYKCGELSKNLKVGDEVIVRPSETVSFKVIIKDIVKADDEDESIRRY